MSNDREQLEREVEQQTHKREELRREVSQAEWNIEELKAQIRATDAVIENAQTKIADMDREEKLKKESDRMEGIRKNAAEHFHR